MSRGCRVLVVVVLLVAAVGVPRAAAAQGRVAALGAVVAVRPLPAALRLAGTGAAWRVWYISTSWSGSRTVVSGTVTVPAGRAPAGGWRIVGFGPGFNGTPDACAASRAGTPPFVRPLGEALLAAGYAVAVTDYEGIGTPGEGSGVHGRAEAAALIDVVRAARRIAPVSRSWAAVGYSLGGHAALWAGSLAASYAPELRHAGTVAVAPTTHPRPVRLAHGTADALPAALTGLTAGQLAAAGTDVAYVPVEGADHFTVLAPVAPRVVGWLGEMFSS